MNHLESKLQDIIDNGGEGVILRDPIAPHQAGRAASYLKHKVQQHTKMFDLTKLVHRNIETAKLKSSNRLGLSNGNASCTRFHLFVPCFPSLFHSRSLSNAWQKRPNGVSFVASEGTTEFVKRWNPKAGDIASFKHRGYLKESRKPKSPALYRGRPDLTWDDIVANWKERKRSTNGTPPPFSHMHW